MAIHTQLPIYKVAYDLLSVATDVTKNMPRDFKASIGAHIRTECVELVVLIFRANSSRNKVPHLDTLLERLQVTEREQLAARITEPWWLALAELILFHDPRPDVVLQGTPALLARVPAHKRLQNQPPHLGLPIGNLSSQFFANVYLDALDQHVKHRIRARHYVRYVDDFVLLHESPQWLNAALADIEAFLPRELHAQLNPRKTVLQPLARGIDFVGQVIAPWRRTLRRRTLREALSRIGGLAAAELQQSANSYFGLLRQATKSHGDRAELANVVRWRGRSVNRQLTKT